MRYYDIQITLKDADGVSSVGSALTSMASGSTPFTNNLRLTLSESNAYAVRVTFNYQSFGDGSLFTQSILTIYNPATCFFTQSKGLQGATIIVKAGIKDSVFTQKLDTSISANDALFVGTIQRAVPNFGGREPSISLLCSPISEDPQSVTQTLESGNVVADYIKNILNIMYPSADVTIDKSAQSITLQNKQTEQRKFKSFSEVCAFATSHNLKIAIEQNEFIIYDSKTTFERTDLAPFEPKTQDFISQPEWQNHSTIQCVFGLRGDLRIGQTITFPLRMATSAQSFIGDASALGGVTNSNALITGGSFKIIGVWHTGDSRNSSANAWATTITATRETDNLSQVGV